MFSRYPTVPRPAPQPQTLHSSYEKAGLTVPGQPIPWNAETVVVEALVKLIPAARRKADFSLRFENGNVIPADSLRPDPIGDDYCRLIFRFPPPDRTGSARVVWRDVHPLGQLTVPILPASEFLDSLKLELPTLFVRIGGQTVACETFVSTQCQGLQATAVLTAPTSLAPLADLGVAVEFRNEGEETVQTVPVPVSGAQLAGKRALLSASPRKYPRRIGSWTATWIVAGRRLFSQRVRAISIRAFQRSLRVSDARFVVSTGPAALAFQVRRQLPPLTEIGRVGPCFVLASREPGIAGMCSLRVCAQVPGAVQTPMLMEQDVLVTDGPTLFAPGTLDVADLGQLTGFELRLKSSVLGTLSLCPIPSAAFTGEGGFKLPVGEFPWTAAADEELTDRLNRLLLGGGSSGM